MRIATLITILLLCGTATGVWIWRTSGNSGDSTPAPSQNISDKKPLIFASGFVEGSQREVELRFEIEGRLDKIRVQAGQRVRVAEVLAELDRSVYVHEVAKAEAQLQQARAERTKLINGARKETREFVQAEVRAAEARLIRAKGSYERMQRLIAQQVISQQAFDDAEAEFNAAKAQYEAAIAKAADVEAPAREDEIQIADAKINIAEAHLKAAQSMLDKTQLKAPSDGLILRVDAENGELVGPESETPLIVLVDDSRLKVRAFVEELDAARVEPSQRAYAVADGIPNLKFWGTVESCAPYMMPKTVFSNKPNERMDVKVREVVIVLDPQQSLSQLVVGLRVDVFIDPDLVAGDTVSTAMKE